MEGKDSFDGLEPGDGLESQEIQQVYKGIASYLRDILPQYHSPFNTPGSMIMKNMDPTHSLNIKEDKPFRSNSSSMFKTSTIIRK